LAQTFTCDLCGKKFYHQKQLEEQYKEHNPKNAVHKGEKDESYAPQIRDEVFAGNAVVNYLNSGSNSPGSY
jgi:hypothetical protein